MEIIKSSKLKISLAGAAAGIINGFFGGGGGMVLVPFLRAYSGMEEKSVFATSVAIALPMCVCSAIIYMARAHVSLISALPYLIGGLFGGIAGGILFKKVPAAILRKAFAIFMIYGGIRSLL